MAARVTIQDIADSLGLSRNTVSKAINNTGVLADSTREKILKRAMEMGYKQFSYSSISGTERQEQPVLPAGGKRDIALFTTMFLSNSHFASTMLDKFQMEVTQLGYTLTIHRILADEVAALQLPKSFIMDRSCGIICFEVFDYAYSSMLCELDIPVLFVDTPVIGLNEPLKADCLYMNNQAEIYSFIQEMNRRGKKRIGFVGECLHCQSFFERYMAFRNAMFLSGLSFPEEYCITGNKEGVKNPSSNDYQEYLTDSIQKLQQLPDVLICANDFIALDTLHVLHKLGYSVPQDIYLCGFDDSPESRIMTPSLTTIHIHSQIMGFSAAHLLISRIKEPSLNYRNVYAETTLIYRESTED
ncbi:MAG: LacI family DNA-binding transcriptional regulator [Lachnospiraceae bacterium]|nr:LacI family DNA-binding transcriptional regulator [Lachnospiraceae bacterium]